MNQIIHKRILLRQINIKDKEQLICLGNNINIWNNLRDYFPHPYTEKHALSFISMLTKKKKKSDFAIEFEGQFIGMCGFIQQIDVHQHTAEIGYWIGEPYWGKGLTAEAVEALCDFCFNKINLKKLYARTFSYNAGSMRVLEKNGFVKEGILKNEIYKNETYHDEHRFGKWQL